MPRPPDQGCPRHGLDLALAEKFRILPPQGQ
jgi:hypothetical protein